MPTEEQTDFTTPDIIWKWLRKPFKPEQIGRLPATAKRPALDFVGHAAVTDRLNKCAPGQWTYTVDERFDHGGQCWVRITLTVLDVSRSDYGDGSDPKEALGNAIRRGAMRFGVGIDLWSKEDLTTSGSGDANSADPSDAIGGKSSDSDPDSGPVSSRGTQGAGPDTASEGEGQPSVGKPGTTSPSDANAVCDHEWQDTWLDPNTGRTAPINKLYLYCPKCRATEKKAKLGVAV